MRKFCIHIGIGIGILVLSCWGEIFNPVLNWLCERGIAGASWLGLATWELAIGTIVIHALWIISLFGLPFRWYDRFRAAAMYYAWGILGLGGGVVAVIVPGFISLWFYKIQIWPVGMIFRLLETIAAITVLVGLACWIFIIIYAMFTPSESEVGQRSVNVPDTILPRTSRLNMSCISKN